MEYECEDAGNYDNRVSVTPRQRHFIIFGLVVFQKSQTNQSTKPDVSKGVGGGQNGARKRRICEQELLMGLLELVGWRPKVRGGDGGRRAEDECSE